MPFSDPGPGARPVGRFASLHEVRQRGENHGAKEGRQLLVGKTMTCAELTG